MFFSIICLLLFIVLLFITIYCLYKYNEYPNCVNYEVIPENPKYFTPYIIDKPPNLHIYNNGTFMGYRAVQDIRYNNIKILCGIYQNYKSEIIIKVNDKQVEYKIEYLGLLIKYNADFPLKYANIILPNMNNIQSIVVNNELIDYIPVQRIDYKYDYTLCINTIRNKFSAKNILNQTLNVYQKEGVSHAIIYYGDISKEVYEVLDYYVKSGFLEIFYWPELEILSYIRNYGQILKMNDCLYRSYYNSRYIINSDIDEIIMPTTFYRLNDLINSYIRMNSKCKFFYFMNKIFPIGNSIDYTEKKYRYVYRNLTPIVDINLFNYRNACNPIFESHKYIVSTNEVICLRVHEVVGVNENEKCVIDAKDGYCRHTRTLLEYHRSRCGRKSEDDTILKYC